MEEVELPQDHFVSRGYQQNFASHDKRVAVLDASSGAWRERDRPIKSNFRERGFTTFVQAGVPHDLLEKAFCSVERRVLNEVRTIGLAKRGPQQKADVANLFAIHLVRSPSFKHFHERVTSSFRDDYVPPFASKAEVRERFIADKGRPPREGELESLVYEVYDRLTADPMTLVNTMIRQHDLMANMLNRFHLQIIEISDTRLPGFAIGDTPIAHARLAEDTYGFKDSLALGDADFIVGPLTRRTAAAFTAKRFEAVSVTTRRMVDTINAVFIRAAFKEVACHPDDARAMAQTFRSLDRLDPVRLTGSGRSPSVIFDRRSSPVTPSHPRRRGR
jgi:hypothetical protein